MEVYSLTFNQVGCDYNEKRQEICLYNILMCGNDGSSIKIGQIVLYVDERKALYEFYFPVTHEDLKQTLGFIEDRI